MIASIRDKIAAYQAKNDVHDFQYILDAADTFIQSFPNGVQTEEELLVGIELLRSFASLAYLGSLREYEDNFKLQNEIITKRIRVFKLCIPESHKQLRGITELLVGMKENSLN